MTENVLNTQDHQQLPVSSPALKGLDRLIGTREPSGGVAGKTRYEWAEGGFFLIQHVDLEQYGQKIKDIEIIGHVHSFGEEPSTADIKSRFYSFAAGMTLDYVYKADGDTLTIWAGEQGSPAYYRGILSADGNTLAGAWVYPGGGGYESTARRIKPTSEKWITKILGHREDDP